MASNYSPSRSPGSLRLHHQLGGGGGVSRLRSSSHKKPPEPLRRAVADCLSSSAASPNHGTPSLVISEASRTLRDYLANSTTTDLAYGVILEHTVAERDRSPAVVARCVALLKRYLLRYKPSEETLLQIDRFCVKTIKECDISSNQRLSPWSRSLNQRSGVLASSTSSSLPPLPPPSTSAFPLPVATFASGALVKSLSYVRSLVAQHIPKRSFQAAALAGATSSSRQPLLPSLSSLLSRSFNSQLSPANTTESVEKKDSTTLSVSILSNISEVDGPADSEYIAPDVLKWRWLGDQPPLVSSECDLQGMSTLNFLEVGAAALLVGDVETKMRGQPWKYFGTASMPYLDQLLQPSSATTVTNSASARPHLRAITASKRTKAGFYQIWDESSASTFRPRPRPLFQYRCYSEQQALRLNSAEVCEVIAAVCSGTSSANTNNLTISSQLSKKTGKPSMDVAVSVLIKLVIDMYVLDSGIAAPLTLSMLQEMLSSPKPACRVRAFDLILNLGVHSHLLEPVISDDATKIEEEFAQESYFDCGDQLTEQEKCKTDVVKELGPSSVNNFESWILKILYEILLLLVQTEEIEESVWASALSCLLYFVCDRGKIKRNQLHGLDIRVIKALIQTSRRNSWADIVHSKLVWMLTNMFYQVPDEPSKTVSTSSFLVDQLDLVGGVEFIFYEYSLATSREERRNSYSVLFDYVLYLINETCASSGVSEYSDDEIQPLASLLALADAPEAFCISVKLGVEGIGELLQRSVAAALSRFPNSERLNTLLEKIMEKFDDIISSFTHLDKEFLHLKQLTKSYKFMERIEALRNDVGMKTKLAWTTLHSLLHSDRVTYRRNGYIWLGDLLIAEISEERDASIWSNIRNIQHQIAHAGNSDTSVDSDAPMSFNLLCGLLKSKNNFIRWGFLFVLERLLMQCKFLLDESEMQQSNSSYVSREYEDNRLEKANAMIDIMSSALSLVAQINETDSINILKMCDILFSQLCLKVPPMKAMPFGDGGKLETCKVNTLRQNGSRWDGFTEEIDNRSSNNIDNVVVFETASMAALLLREEAIVPMQLVARVPAALFDWPLIQLAGAATDNIALGVAVGSNGRGNIPGSTSDIRATLLLLLIGKCTADAGAFQDVGGEEFFRGLLDDTDSRVAYYSSSFLLKRMMTENPDKYQYMLQKLIFKAQQDEQLVFKPKTDTVIYWLREQVSSEQQSNNEKLLENPYLQMRGIVQLSNEL